ncbi:MAG: helix-turn-helix domain-containing protein [Deltaproteobacteria bacterium]
MNYLSHSPGPPLARWVDHLWSLTDAPSHTRESILPSGTLELVINLHENELRIYDPSSVHSPRRLSGAIVSGAYRAPFVIDTREHASIMGVHFKPGGAFPLLGALPGELGNLHLDLETLWSGLATELRERLCEETTPEHRFRRLERTLVARLHCARECHRAVPVALEKLSESRATVAEIAACVGLSHRRLIEVFTAEVGMTPKLFARVQRFQRTLATARRSASADWAGLALTHGYSDQSHLIRDFVAFSGFSPETLLRHRDDPVKENHVALTEGGGSNSSNTPERLSAISSAKGRHHDRNSPSDRHAS